MKIDIRDGIDDLTALELISIVVGQGRISKGKDKMYYCWCTEIRHNDEYYRVWVRDNRKDDCFVVTKKK